MAYMSARELLSGLPVKMAEGGAVQSVLDYITNNPGASVAAIATQVNNSGASVNAVADALGIDRAVAQEAYTTANKANQDYLEGEQSFLDQISDPLGYGGDPNYYNTPEYNAFAYSELLKADAEAQKNNTTRINIQGALDAGVAQSTIDRIFTTPAGSPAYAGPDPTATMSADVQGFFDTIMEDDKIDASERLVMQIAATDQGLTYDDILALGVNPNVLYNTPAAVTPTTCPEGYTRNAAGDCQENVTVCGDGFILNPVTGNCVPNNSIPVCGEGKKYNPATDQCEDIFTEVDTYTGTGEESATGVEVYDPTGFGTDPTVFAPATPATPTAPAVPAAPSLDTTFRKSTPPRTEIIDAYGGLVDFDYSPGASLTSATGSGYNFTPPTVTSRPRSLMSGAQLGRYTGGRAAADLRQLTTGLGNGRTYSDYAGVLQNPGSYSGGLSKSQLYSRMRGLDYQRDAATAADRQAAEADRQASAARGDISAYLAANPDIAASYESQKGRLGGQSLEQFARNHYNTMGRAEMDAGTRGLFTLVESTGGGAPIEDERFFRVGEGEGGVFEDSGSPNWNSARQLGRAGGVTRQVFAQGGPVKKPKGFAGGGSSSADLKALNKYAGGGIIDSAIKKGAEALGFDDERQVAISQEAVEITNQMVDAGLIEEQYRVELLMPKDASQRTRQNTGIKGDEEVFNAVNHALFAYDAGQSTLGTLGAQAKEVYQGLSRKIGGNDPRSEYLDYFNNKFGFNLAEQGLSREEAKNAIMNNLGNVDNQGTRGRMIRGEELKAGVDLLTNVQDARYPWE